MSRCGEARLSKESLQLQLEKEFRSLRHIVANVVIHAESSVPQPTPGHAAFCPSQMQGAKLSNQPRQREFRPFGPCTLRVWAAAKRPPASMDPRAN